MKKFLGKIVRFALRNLVLMVCLVMLGVWGFNFPRNFHPKFTNSFSASNLDAVQEESMPTLMMQKSISRGISMPVPIENKAFAVVSDAERKIIKNASLTIEVDDTEITKDLVEEKVKELGGAITNMNSYEVRPGVLAYNLTLRVPSDKLEVALENIASLGIKKNESFNSRDITEQYLDTANQIKNLEARRDRLRELMKFKTDNLNDVLQIDRELSSVQNQIENLQRTQKRRDTDVAYSIINLNIQPKPQIGDFSSPAEWNLERTWKEAVNDLIHSLQNLAKKAIQIIVYAPIWLPILIILWLIQKAIRRRLDHTKKPAKK